MANSSTGDRFHVMGDMDEYGRISHIATYDTASKAVDHARQTKGGAVVPGIAQGVEIPYLAGKRMSQQIKDAWAAA